MSQNWRRNQNQPNNQTTKVAIIITMSLEAQISLITNFWYFLFNRIVLFNCTVQCSIGMNWFAIESCVIMILWIESLPALALHCIALQFIRELIATSTTTVQLLQYWYDPLSQRQSKWSFMLGTKLTKLFQWNIVNQMIWLVNIKLGVALRHCIWKLNIEHCACCMLHALH